MPNRIKDSFDYSKMKFWLLNFKFYYSLSNSSINLAVFKSIPNEFSSKVAIYFFLKLIIYVKKSLIKKSYTLVI